LYDRYLRRRHFQVIGIQDARRVMEMAPKDQPQAIILDIMMPALDGWEILQMIKAHPHTRHIPVVVALPGATQTWRSLWALQLSSESPSVRSSFWMRFRS
jgi:CheY-like chemotaxis protein